MILLGDFFDIISLESDENSINALLEIDPGHKIFEGHFPNQPVVPGVCQLQMIKEVLEQQLQQQTQLHSAAEMKFLAVIDPTQNNIINVSIKYTIEETQVKATASLFREELMHFKFKGTLVVP